MKPDIVQLAQELSHSENPEKLKVAESVLSLLIAKDLRGDRITVNIISDPIDEDALSPGGESSGSTVLCPKCGEKLVLSLA